MHRQDSSDLESGIYNTYTLCLHSICEANINWTKSQGKNHLQAMYVGAVSAEILIKTTWDRRERK